MKYERRNLVTGTTKSLNRDGFCRGYEDRGARHGEVRGRDVRASACGKFRRIAERRRSCERVHPFQLAIQR